MTSTFRTATTGTAGVTDFTISHVFYLIDGFEQGRGGSRGGCVFEYITDFIGLDWSTVDLRFGFIWWCMGHIISEPSFNLAVLVLGPWKIFGFGGIQVVLLGLQVLL